MWTRAQLKSFAKQELRFSYWVSFAVCLVGTILAGGAGSGGLGGGSGSVNLKAEASAADPSLFAILAGFFSVAVIFSLAYSLFVALPIEVGMASFFVRAPQGDRRFGNLFSSFAAGRYTSSVKAMFRMYLSIFLWSLLFIIPGIIKSYQYRMVPYLISENPSFTPAQALELSKRMTDGEKWAMFVLDLSFIGWILLGVLALGIGTLFVVPYMEATWAQLYFVLRQKVMGPPMNGPMGYYGPEIP